MRNDVFGMGVFWSHWRGNLLPKRWMSNPRAYDEAQLDLIVRAGGRATTVGLAWESVERTRGVRIWDETDFQVNAAAERGLSLYAYIGHTPDWAVPAGRNGERLPGYRTPPDEKYRDDFRRYCRDTAERYRGKVFNYHFWNEPNGCSWIRNGCRNSGEYAAYTRWLKDAYLALKDGDPDCRVGAAVLDYNSQVTEGWRYIQGIYDEGGGDYFDAIDIHPYADEGLHWRAVHDTRAVMVANGDAAKDIWIGEYGWRRTADPSAALYLRDVLERFCRPEYSYVTHCRFLVVSDLNEAVYGLTDINLEERPLYDEYRSLASRLKPQEDRSLINDIPLSRDLLGNSERFSGSGRLVLEAETEIAEYDQEVEIRARPPCACGRIVWTVDGTPQEGTDDDRFLFSATPEDETVYCIKARWSDDQQEQEESVFIRVHPFVSTGFSIILSTENGHRRARTGEAVPLTTRVLNRSSHDLEFRWFEDDVHLEGESSSRLAWVPEGDPGRRRITVECLNAGLTATDTLVLEVEAPGVV